jgi:hypothetical protein
VSHFVPAWTYNPIDSRKPKKSKEQAVAELKEVVLSCTEGKFTPTIIKSDSNYVNAEFQGPIFGVRVLPPFAVVYASRFLRLTALRGMVWCAPVRR